MNEMNEKWQRGGLISATEESLSLSLSDCVAKVNANAHQ